MKNSEQRADDFGYIATAWGTLGIEEFGLVVLAIYVLDRFVRGLRITLDHQWCHPFPAIQS